ncbi:hypothetical protein ILUMI_19159, partial [Ignelater luminosus]
KNEEITKKITSLGLGLCGLRYRDATRDLDTAEWTLVATDKEGRGYVGMFQTFINSEEEYRFNTTVSLGQEYDLNCYPKGSFCHIFNPNGEMVESRACRYTIALVKRKHIGLWKCQILSFNSMDSIESTIELIASVSTAPISWTNETEHYVHVGCQIFRRARYCRLTAPNGKMLQVDVGYATDRHFAFGTDLSKGICSIMISKPLQYNEKGLWKCELADPYFERTGTLILVAETTPMYPKFLKLSATLNKPLTINCEVPYSTDYCRIQSPKSPLWYSPDNEEELSLGRCSHHIENATIDNMGSWTCMFARETGLTDEKIIVNVAFDEILQFTSEVKVPLDGDAELLCKTNEVPLGYCRFVSPRGDNYHIRDTDTGSSHKIIFWKGSQLW